MEFSFSSSVLDTKKERQLIKRQLITSLSFTPVTLIWSLLVTF